MCLLIFPLSVFVGLINRYVDFVSRSVLWSLIVIKACCSGKLFTFWSTFRCANFLGFIAVFGFNRGFFV